jgi:hypothetical protein
MKIEFDVIETINAIPDFWKIVICAIVWYAIASIGVRAFMNKNAQMGEKIFVWLTTPLSVPLGIFFGGLWLMAAGIFYIVSFGYIKLWQVEFPDGSGCGCL